MIADADAAVTGAAAFASGAGGVSAVSRKSTQEVAGAATSMLAVDAMKPAFAAATWYRPGSRPGIVNVPSEPLIAVRSAPVFTLCAVIRTCATGCLLAESRVTPPTPPNKSAPQAGVNGAASWQAMQAGKTAERNELRVISVLSATDVTVVHS
jgi:hypothetical protein